MQWIIGDVHGCFIELLKLLQLIKFRSATDQAINLGDLVDRGEHSKAVFDFVRIGQEKGYFRVIRGNHEDEWLRAVRMDVEDWYSDKHSETWHDFDGHDGIHKFAEWVDTLPLYIETEHALLVHAGMEPDKHYTKQSAESLLWTRSMELIPAEHRDGKIVVHGHTPVGHPLILPDQVNIDTGCLFGGQLTALSLDALGEGEIVWRSVDGWRKKAVS